MKKTENSSSVVKLDDDDGNAKWRNEDRLACLGDTCIRSSGKVDDDCSFDHPLAGYEEECACYESGFKAENVAKSSEKESVDKLALLDVSEWEKDDEYVTDRMTPFLSVSIESSSPRSPILAAWNGMYNIIEETFSPGHVRKGALEMNNMCFLRKAAVDCKNHHLEIITPGLSAIGLPIPRSLGGETEAKDATLITTISPGLAAVTLPLPRRLKSVVETKKDILPIAPGLSCFQLPLPSDLNHFARIRDDMTHTAALSDMWNTECSSSSKEKGQYLLNNEQHSKGGKSSEGGREQTGYNNIEDQECEIQYSNIQVESIENEKMQKACRPFHVSSTLSESIVPVTTGSRIDSTRGKNSSVAMTMMHDFAFPNASHVTKSEEAPVRVGALSSSAECAGLGLSEEFASAFNMEGNCKSNSEVMLLSDGNMHIAQRSEGVVQPHNDHLQLENSSYNTHHFSKTLPSQYMKKEIGVYSSAHTKESTSSPPTQFRPSKSEVHEITAEQLWYRLKEVTAMLQPLLSRDSSQPPEVDDWGSRVKVQREEYRRQTRNIMTASKGSGKDIFVAAPIASTATASCTSTLRSGQTVVSPYKIKSASLSLSPPSYSGDSFGRSGDGRKPGRTRCSRVKPMSSARRRGSVTSNSTQSAGSSSRTPSPSPSPTQSSPSPRRIQSALPSRAQSPASPSRTRSVTSSSRTPSPSPSPTQSSPSPRRIHSALPSRAQSPASPTRTQSVYTRPSRLTPTSRAH